MTPRTAHDIGQLVTRIQHDFLDRPGLALTRAEAEARFALVTATCDALLHFLADAGVLARVFREGEHAFLLRRAGGTGLPANGHHHCRAPAAATRTAPTDRAGRGSHGPTASGG